MLFLASLAFLLACPPASASPQQPPQTIAARDVVADFRLVPLLDGPNDPVWTDEQHTQVLTRAKMLNVDEHSATRAWIAAQSALQQAQPCAAPATAPTPFAGTLASQLNKLLQRPEVSAVLVTSPQLQLDQPILLNRDGVALDLGRTELVAATSAPYMVRIEGAKNVSLGGGTFRTGNWGLLIARSSHVIVAGVTMSGLTGGGTLVTASNDVTIANNLLQSLGRAPVLIHGASQNVRVLRNEIRQNLGFSNWDAGVVLSDRNADLESDPQNLLTTDGYWPQQQPITSRLVIPQNNLIAWNHIAANTSSGIYSDGSVRNVFLGNQIENNAKEGICLDNGSSADVVAFNLIRGNGKRWGQTDAALRLDFVLSFGRLPDGTSPARLPGISVDNAAYNQVVFNNVDQNSGSGIKTVRTAFYNRIGGNTVTSNNQGLSDTFHFFGIELGSAMADEPLAELDFRPSRGNQIFANSVQGAHYSGIFFADGSDQNNVFDNAILGATDWSLESVTPQPNTAENNLTTQPARNITSGLLPDPALCLHREAPEPKPQLTVPKHPARPER